MIRNGKQTSLHFITERKKRRQKMPLLQDRIIKLLEKRARESARGCESKSKRADERAKKCKWKSKDVEQREGERKRKFYQ